MVVVGEAGWDAMEAANKSKTEGMEVVPTANLDPPEVGGFKAVPKTHKESPR